MWQLPLPSYAILSSMFLSQPFPIPIVWTVIDSVLARLMTSSLSFTAPSVRHITRCLRFGSAWFMINVKGLAISVPPKSLIKLLIYFIASCLFSSLCSITTSPLTSRYIDTEPKLIMENLHLSGRLWRKRINASFALQIRSPCIE